MIKKDFFIHGILSLCLVFAVSLAFSYKIPWLLTSLIIVTIFLLIFVSEFEKQKVDTRILTLLGIITATAVVSRQIMHAMGEASPVFFLVIIAGYVFGPLFGFMIGSLTMFISNFSLGHGPWTPFQMLGLGLGGLFAGLLPRSEHIPNKVVLALYGFVIGYVYGAINNLFYWLAFTAEHSIETFIAVSGASFALDTSRAIFTALLLFFLTDPIEKIFLRYKKRFEPSSRD
ncbi:MAG: ECF transporter S component [Candidatus Altiarchaeota archaeon]